MAGAHCTMVQNMLLFECLFYFVECTLSFTICLFFSIAAVNDSALATEVLVQYDVSLKQRTYATNETALEMAERLRSHLVAILLYEVTYRKS